MKTKSLENKRTSILTDNLDHCIVCGAKKDNIHEVFFGKNRRNSMLYGFCIPLCFKCHLEIHSNNLLDLKFKQLCQAKYEETHSREDFLQICHKNYL